MDQQYGLYVNKTLDELQTEFVAVQIYINATTKNCPVGSGSRYMFWVIGDGGRTMFYQPIGWPIVISNKDFGIVKVIDSVTTMAIDGRVKYKMTECGDWYDLGPIVPSGFDPEQDSSFEPIRKSYLADKSQQSDLMSDELMNAKKSGELDDLFSMGDAFD